MYILYINIYTALQAAQSTYEEKVVSTSKVAEKTLFDLVWQVQELEDLIKFSQKLVLGITVLAERVRDEKCDVVIENVKFNPWSAY